MASRPSFENGTAHFRPKMKHHDALGDCLVVACSTDEFNTIKGKKSTFSYRDRARILEACRFVDQVIPEENWDQKANDIRTYKADICAMGDDWAGNFDSLREETGCVVTYLPRTPDISTTDVKSVIRQINEDKLRGILNTVDQLRDQISNY